MGFLMDGLDAEAYDRSYSDRELLNRIIGYFQSHWSLMVFVAVMIMLNSAMDAILPILIAQGIDTLAEADSIRAAIWLVVAILLSGALVLDLQLLSSLANRPSRR